MENIKNALIQSFIEVIPMFGITATYEGESEIPNLRSADQVNIIIGLTSGIEGSIVLGLDQNAAFKITSAMMGGMEVSQIDKMTESALGELMNILVGTALQKIGSNILIDISPPTLVIAKRTYIMISRTKSYRLQFKIDENIYNISFSTEA